jgi:two-component system, OmpR family, response regulator TctD
MEPADASITERPGIMSDRILIIEDEPMLADALSEFLATQGYEVHCAAEREQAEALLAHHAYALVITDLALSPLGLSGVDVLDCIADRATRPKVIVYSGHVDPELTSRLEPHGVDVFLQKPQPLGEVARVAACLLGRPA